ncbi:hypothetical protein N0V84_012047 [Fusarium piperis]|uniref:Uncharacterized protein n=1 Tax=Fusarium piperis TaxID=1435070 RepID=A0A9W8TA13_9HYPO|nr:hypothetical protein N0V84_012047 [Fusarium piperis]
MTSPTSREPTPFTLPVSELIAMSDEELMQFMKEHRDAEGNYNLPVDGWEKLSKDQRDCLASRLKAKERVLSLGIEPSSRPLNLDDLDARLRQVPSDSHLTEAQYEPQAAELSRHASPATNHRAQCKEFETEFYHELVSDGGRPLYPIDQIDHVLKNPEEHREMLRPWQKTPRANDPFDIFQIQLDRWRDFRKWQKDNRRLEDENDSYEAYVKYITYWRKKSALEDACAEFLANMEADPLYLKPQWEQKQIVRRWERAYRREHGCHDSGEYFEAVKRRLANHHFTRLFELNEDPAQQDQLTTWIEYLSFEYWWLDQTAGDIERLAPEHDKAWQELVDSRLVGPRDTPESIRSDQTALKHENESQGVNAEVQMAREEYDSVHDLTQKSPQRFLISNRRRAEMLDKAAQDLEGAEQRKKEIKARHDKVRDFVRGTFDYVDAKRRLACHGLLVQWILEQLPLVEAEMAQAEAEESRASQNKGKKRMLSPQEESPAGPSQKRQKTGQGSPSPKNGNSTELTEIKVQAQEKSEGPRQIKAIGKRQRRSTYASSLPPGGLRRSARIAARQPPPQPEPRQLRPRPVKKATGQLDASTATKGMKGGRVGKKRSGIKAKSKQSRR